MFCVDVTVKRWVMQICVEKKCLQSHFSLGAYSA